MLSTLSRTGSWLWLLLLLIITAGSAVSCKAGSISPTLPSKTGIEFAAGLPTPANLHRQAAYNNGQRTLQGDHYTYIGAGHDDLVEIDGTSLVFSPDWSGPQPRHIWQAARAGFSFNVPDYDGPAQIDMQWAVAPVNSDDLYIGLANWGADHWDWYQCDPLNLQRIDLPGMAEYSSTAGVFVVVLLLGTQPATLDWIRIGPELWRVEAITAADDIGQYSSLALDSAGRPHIACFNATAEDLAYYWYDGSVWQTTMVDTAGAVGKHASLALDSIGQAWISYYDETNADLKVAHYDGSTWNISLVDGSLSVTGLYTSLRLNAAELPCIAYYEATGNAVRYAVFDGSVWSYDTVAAGTIDPSSQIALAFDADWTPHVAYSVGMTGIRHAWFDGLAWQSEAALTDQAPLSTNRALAIDAAGYPHIVAYNYAALQPQYAYKDGGGWHVSLIPITSPSGSNAAIAIDAAGEPWISCYGAGLELLHLYADTWHQVTVDSNGWAGHYTSLAIDPASGPRISYYHPGNKTLMYAEYVATS